MRILIVEDEAAVAQCLAEALAEQGHAARLAGDGPAALELLASERPDAVFLDVALPGMRGIEVLRRIRASDPDLPVVVVTAHAEPDELAAARALGVTEILEKPFVLRNLEAALGGLGAR